MRSLVEPEISPSRILVLVGLVFILSGCDETALQAERPEASATKEAGFEAVIAGSYEGAVSGNGVLTLLREAGFERKGYFFLSDGRGFRPHGVTFVLPRGIAPGKHELGSPSPLNIGTVPSVRVDRDLGDSVLSAERNTSGFLELIAFPENESGLSGSEVAGNFEFETENRNGEKIAVNGKFSFQVE